LRGLLKPGSEGLAGLSGHLPPKENEMSKFGSLIADVSKPHKTILLDPVTEQPILDNSGKAAFIAGWAADSERGRSYDKQKRKELILRVKSSRNGQVEPDDALEQNIAKCAALVDSWYLVDRVTREAIDVPCTPENAADLLSEPGAGWIFLPVWIDLNSAANFLQSPSPPSGPMPSGTSETAA
jgi:hypothetical protein